MRGRVKCPEHLEPSNDFSLRLIEAQNMYVRYRKKRKALEEKVECYFNGLKTQIRTLKTMAEEHEKSVEHLPAMNSETEDQAQESWSKDAIAKRLGISPDSILLMASESVDIAGEGAGTYVIALAPGDPLHNYMKQRGTWPSLHCSDTYLVKDNKFENAIAKLCIDHDHQEESGTSTYSVLSRTRTEDEAEGVNKVLPGNMTIQDLQWHFHPFNVNFRESLYREDDEVGDSDDESIVY